MYWLIGLVMYFIPTIVAHFKRKANFTSILLLNFFLGWTILGWVGALVWATTVDKK